MAIVQVDRDVIGYLGHFEFGTDRAGRFAFTNIPPNQTWYLYGPMDSVKGYGSIPVRTIKRKRTARPWCWATPRSSLAERTATVLLH
jgi:hypothetical protein